MFELLPWWYQLSVVALLGAVMASFTNVVVYRFHTNASLAGRSRCFSCGQTLRWYELVPVVSYLALQGRCRSCRARIAARDLLVELGLAAAFVYLFWVSPNLTIFFFAAVLASVLTAVVLYDLAHMIIPNEFVVAALLVALGLFAATSWPVTLATLAVHTIASLISFSAYALLWKVSAGRWIGFGDAKLAIPLGFLLTPPQAFSMIVLSFWVGAAIALTLLAAQSAQTWYRRRAYARSVVAKTGQYLTMKSEIPFAPFLVIAFALVYLFGADVLGLTSYVLVP